VNERITITVALSVTVDPGSWYSRFHADPGIDIPDRMLSHLRMLPGIREAGGTVELHRLLRQGSRNCRQSAQHRCVGASSLNPLARRSLALPRRDSVDRLLHLCRHLANKMRRMYCATLTHDRRIPNEPSADFL
jgi:hypothetical protein